MRRPDYALRYGIQRWVDDTSAAQTASIRSASWRLQAAGGSPGFEGSPGIAHASTAFPILVSQNPIAALPWVVANPSLEAET